MNRILGEFHGIRGKIISHRVWGVPANALILELPEASYVLSSREGYKQVAAICNCYLPETIWRSFDAAHSDNWQRYLEAVLATANLSPHEITALSTGVNMNDLAWREEAFDQLWALAFVTAGVNTNAMRVGKDKASHIERNGAFDKVGTINTVVLTGARLDLTALAASFITVTEAKNIALQELDVRSSYTPEWLATGTGTDQIIVVSGKGDQCTYVGGHTKMGELMARAVTAATVSAIKNNSRVNS